LKKKFKDAHDEPCIIPTYLFILEQPPSKILNKWPWPFLNSQKVFSLKKFN